MSHALQNNPPYQDDDASSSFKDDDASSSSFTSKSEETTSLSLQTQPYLVLMHSFAVSFLVLSTLFEIFHVTGKIIPRIDGQDGQACDTGQYQSDKEERPFRSREPKHD